MNSRFFRINLVKIFTFFSLISKFTKTPHNKRSKSHSILFKYNFILALFCFFFFLFSKSPHKPRESENMNIKMYENEIERKIVSPNMEYKFD
jgi:hypothetical protein